MVDLREDAIRQNVIDGIREARRDLGSAIIPIGAEEAALASLTIRTRPARSLRS
jgi:hypothetical protein